MASIDKMKGRDFTGTPGRTSALDRGVLGHSSTCDSTGRLQGLDGRVDPRPGHDALATGGSGVTGGSCRHYRRRAYIADRRFGPLADPAMAASAEPGDRRESDEAHEVGFGGPGRSTSRWDARTATAASTSSRETPLDGRCATFKSVQVDLRPTERSGQPHPRDVSDGNCFYTRPNRIAYPGSAVKASDKELRPVARWFHSAVFGLAVVLGFLS